MTTETKDVIEVINWCVTASILIATAVYIYLAPLKAVRLAQKLDQIKGREDAKRQLFYTLFSFRGLAINTDFVNGLNTIEIIFQDNKEIIDAWHKLRDAYNLRELADPGLTWDLLKTDLLSKMAVSLGYKNLNPIDIIFYYTPQGHAQQQKTASELQTASYNFHYYGTEVYKAMLAKMQADLGQGASEERQA